MSIPVWTIARKWLHIGITAKVGPSVSLGGRDELWSMTVIAFLVFYGNSMIAPLVPALARGFGVRPYALKWLVPGFSILYGTATLFYGHLSDRFGRYPVLRILLSLAALTTFSLSLP